MGKPKYKRVNLAKCTHVSITQVDEELQRIFYSDEDEITESWKWNDFYQYYQQAFGRCVSPVMLSKVQGPIQIGWVFQKIRQYEDTGEDWEQLTWVSFYKKTETPTVWEYPI